MDGNDFIALLGLTLDDQEVQKLLEKTGVGKKPRRSDFDFAAFLSSKKLGLEITFKDEQAVKVRRKDYEEGALVVTNIRMYGKGGSQGFAQFEGELPHGLQASFGLKEVEARLGKAAKAKKDVAMARWDFKDHSLHINFDRAHKEIQAVAVQLPVLTK